MINYNDIQIGDRITTDNNHDKVVFTVTAKINNRLVIQHGNKKGVLRPEHFAGFKKVLGMGFKLTYKPNVNSKILSVL